MWVYRKHVARRDENDDPVIIVWQVGYFVEREFSVITTYNSEFRAAKRCHWLNGGNPQ